MHGYGIGQRIQQLAQDMLQVEEGTLYPALYRIENRGWIEGQWGKYSTLILPIIEIRRGDRSTSRQKRVFPPG